jgi:hypothetical protein
LVKVRRRRNARHGGPGEALQRPYVEPFVAGGVACYTHRRKEVSAEIESAVRHKAVQQFIVLHRCILQRRKL